MKLFKGIFYIFLTLLITVSLSGSVNAEIAGGEYDDVVTPQVGGGSMEDAEAINFFTLLQTIYGIVFPAIVIIGFLKVVIAGYTIMTSQGDPKSVQQGKEDLTAAIMGMIFILGAVGILRILVGSIITGGDPGF